MSSGPPPRRRAAGAAVLLGTAALILLADQLTKGLVAANIPIGGRVEVLGDVVQLWHVQNSGAAFSLFQNGRPVFLVISVAALALIGYFFWSLGGRHIAVSLLLGLALGGTLGNLADRIRDSQGYVTDFVSVGIGDARWPTFNIADASIDIGIVGFVLLLFLLDRTTASRDRVGAVSGDRPPGDAPADTPQ